MADDESGYSIRPVVGVILMIGVTVLLAAIMGTFVLDIGPQGEPTISIEADISPEFLLLTGLNVLIVGFLWSMNEKLTKILERLQSPAQSRPGESKVDASELEEDD